ncbi:MAG: CAP domain-containing protein [Steroidobacteraceae bacterium]
MKIPAAILLTLLALLASQVAPSRTDLVAEINGIRAQGCAGHSSVQTTLRLQPQLDRVAQALASGRSLRDAMKDADYRAVQSATLEVSGSDEAIVRALAERGCRDIVDPVYRDVGVAQRAGNAWIVLAAPFVPPTASEAETVSRKVLELVNEARAHSRRCGWRRFDAAKPLVPSDTLQRAALAHAHHIAGRSILSHAGNDGSTPAERAARAGYRWRVVGENIAAGQSTPELVVAEWVRSPRHCSNLMDADFSEMGVAYAVERRSAKGIYWVQMFGAPRGQSDR